MLPICFEVLWSLLADTRTMLASTHFSLPRFDQKFSAYQWFCKKMAADERQMYADKNHLDHLRTSAFICG